MGTLSWVPRTVWSGLAGAVLVLASCAPAAAPSSSAAPAPQPAPAQPAAPAALPAPAPTAALRPTPTPRPMPTPTAVGTQVKKGGVLKGVIWADPANLDMLEATSIVSLAAIGLSYDGLVKEDPLKPGQVVPDLAERWTVSGDGAKVTFALRKGVTFHNGRPFTSADAKRSVERWMKDTDQLAPTLSAVIKSVEAPDPNTLLVNLKFPYPDLFKTFMMDWASVIPADQPTGRNVKEVIGTGPFRFKRYQSSVAYEVVRNESYWNKGLPHLDGVTVYVISDRTTGLAAFRAGQIDITVPIYPTVAQHKAVDTQMKGQATAYLYPNSNWTSLYMPNSKKPWSDARVRKAAFMAIDRKQAVATVTQGLGTADGVLPPSLSGLSREEMKSVPGWREPKSLDVEEAKKLLAEAGYPKGFKTDIFRKTGADYEALVVFLKDQLGKIGIEATNSTRPGAAFFDFVYARSYQSMGDRHVFAPVTPDTILAQYYRSGSARNFADIADRKLDEMIDRQMSTLDPQERKKQLRAIETYLYDNGLATILSWGSYSQVWQKWVRGFVPGETTFNNVRLETVWLDR
ncbi:MAG: ABC transporter substrate-binding protein [Chloroflexi bacterium]|nr:ABC transporter substrate-binding protein [Chloroflexota bacterium]